MSFHMTANILKLKNIKMITPEEIESFLHGNDPEEHIVAIEYDWASENIESKNFSISVSLITLLIR